MKQKYNIDLHVHTKHGSPCAELNNPEQIPAMMQERDLRGVVIAEHDMLWSQREITELNETLSERKIFRGVEISTSIFHFVVIGLDNMDGIYPGITPVNLAKIVMDKDAAMILVHPHVLRRDTVIDDVLSAIPEYTTAMEIYSTSTVDGDSDYALNIASELSLKMVAGSDAHYIEKLGETYTAFPEMPENEKELAAMIKNGAGIPMRRE